MLHEMKINDSAFDRMNKGLKKREYRVNDEKRKKVRVGDVIEFHKISNMEEKILMNVKKIEYYKTLEEAVTLHFEEDFRDRYNDIGSAVNSFFERGYYNKKEIKKYGIVVFCINN